MHGSQEDNVSLETRTELRLDLGRLAAGPAFHTLSLLSAENLIRTLADLQPRFNPFIQILPLSSGPLVSAQCPRGTSGRQNPCGIPEPLKDTGSWENPFPYCSQLRRPNS